MRLRRFRSPSRAAWFAILMTVAAVLSLLPSEWTRWKRGPAQALAFLASPILGASQTSGDGGARTSGPLSLEDAEKLRTFDELQRLVIHQQLRIEEIEQRTEVGERIRGIVRDRRSALFFARVIKFDSDRKRRSMTINVGSVDGIRPGWPVAAGVPPQELSSEDDRRAALFRQWLIGKVDSVSTYTSEVILSTDPAYRVGVLPVRVLKDGTPQPASESATMLGDGGIQMIVDDATQDYFEHGFRYLVTSPTETMPDQMLVGTIVSARPSTKNALRFELKVTPFSDVRKLRSVFVIGEAQ